jgi:catechol 2,3-dioxygenase-like lactoylglutathione lyase family enzyme
MRHVSSPYVDPTQQLVVEVFARDIARSKAFYEALGFAMVSDRGSFVVLTWEGHELYLDERTDLPPPPPAPQANVRIMVPDVDAYWERARALAAPVFAEIADREYGLRDFTILDPDGVGLRFGTRLAADLPGSAASHDA